MIVNTPMFRRYSARSDTGNDINRPLPVRASRAEAALRLMAHYVLVFRERLTGQNGV